MPSELKARVYFGRNYMTSGRNYMTSGRNYTTLVIASNIQWRTLAQRIDARLAHFTDASIGDGSVRLRYRDEDGDYVWIDSDEALRNAFLDWRGTHADNIATGSVGEIVLFCSSRNDEPLTENGWADHMIGSGGTLSIAAQ